MDINHTDLNKERTQGYQKKQEHEQFLKWLNKTLNKPEQAQYEEKDIQHPFLFVIGLPRSGTTLLSQLLAHCLDVGFINNLAARFWKAPVSGIRLARLTLGQDPYKAFESHYGSTDKLRDIHEFGYFWREWLLKDSFNNIKNARQIEDQINWEGLRVTLANMQAEFNRPMVFKNIFGSYHMHKLNETLGKVHWIYIDRDPLDVAVSILQARQKYYDDPNTWWSYVPPDYEKIITLDYWHQIAGQIHFLKTYFQKQMKKLKAEGKGTSISYEELCKDPMRVLQTLNKQLTDRFGRSIEIIQSPPQSFELRTYTEHKVEKERFKKLLEEFDQYD